MSESLTVNVTEEDIYEGRCQDPGWCAIAVAIRREHGFGYVSVGGSFFSVAKTGGARDLMHDRRFRLPAKAKDFIRHFDEGRDVEPFTFTAEEVADE